MQPSVLEPEHRARWGPACGVAFVVLLVVSLIIESTRIPISHRRTFWPGTTSAVISVSWDQLILTDIAVVFGIFWFGYLRDRWGRTDLGARLSPVLLAGAAIFATGGLIFNGSIFALLDKPKHMLPATAQTLNFMQSDLGAAALVVGVSIVMWAAAVIILKTRILPVWLAWVSFVLAVVALAGPVGFFAFLAMGIWILIVAFLMWRFEENLPAPGDALERPAAGGTPADPGRVPFPC